MSRYKCPCCGYYTFEDAEDAFFEICEVCFWQNDTSEEHKVSGANHMTLADARKNFLQYGACREKSSAFVRHPYDYELPQNNQE